MSEKFKTYMNSLTTEEIIEFSKRISTHWGYLYQIKSGKRIPSPAFSVKLEKETGISRYDFRPHDGREIWGSGN